MKTILDMSQLIHEAYEIADSINSSEAMHEYLQRKRELENDEEAQRLIRKFQRKKEAFEEVQRFGKYHPDYKTISREVRKFKRQMDMHPAIANFKLAENKLDELLYSVAHTLAHSVSETIKVPSNNPFLDKSGGGCGSGGSCGCGH